MLAARPARRRAADFVRPRRSPTPSNSVHLVRTAMGGIATIDAAGVLDREISSGWAIVAGSIASTHWPMRPAAVVCQVRKIHPLRGPFPRHDPAIVIVQFPMPRSLSMLMCQPFRTAWACSATTNERAVERLVRPATLAAPRSARSQRGRRGPPPTTLPLGPTPSVTSRSAYYVDENIGATASHDHVLGPGGMPLGWAVMARQAGTGQAATGYVRPSRRPSRPSADSRGRARQGDPWSC